MIAVTWGSIVEEAMRWAYALDVTAWGTGLLLVVETTLVALGIAAWRRGRHGLGLRHPAEPGTHRALRPVA